MKKDKKSKLADMDNIKKQAAAISAVPNQDEIHISLTAKRPPRFVRSIKDLIFWEYAKIIAESAGFKENYRFTTNKYKNLCCGNIKWKSADKDVQERLMEEAKCIYCGCKSDLSIDHLIPRSKGGPDIPANAVCACKKCNSSKNNVDVFEWYYIKKNKKCIPLHIWKRYLKLIWEFHALHRTLDKVDINRDGKLDLLDLSAVFKM